MQSLSEVSIALRDLVARAGASLVHVRGRRGYGASGLVWASDLVLTSARAFEREEELVISYAGESRSAERLGQHPATDLLVLRVQGGLPTLPRASATPELGELVLVLARPTERLRARLGVVSSSAGEWRVPGGARMERYIETDIAPSPALAVSALIAMDGALIGLNHPGLARGALVTLPAASVSELIEQLSSHGRVRRGHLGVIVHPVRLPSAVAGELGRGCGLMVMSVREDSPAERGGVLLGDVLLELAGEPLSRPEDLEAGLGAPSIGSERELRVLRANTVQMLSVKAEERP